jgi:hypothetical protein
MLTGNDVALEQDAPASAVLGTDLILALTSH